MTIIRNSNDADGINTFPATVETVGQTDITVSTPEGTQFGGNTIRVKAPQGHGLRKGDGVLIDNRGFLVIEGDDDTEQAPEAPKTPAAPAFAMGDRVRITGERFNGRTGTVTNEYGTVNNPQHHNFGRTWVGVKLDQTASAYTPRARVFTDKLELTEGNDTEPEAAPLNVQRGRGKVHAPHVIEGYVSTPMCGGNRSAEGYSETSAAVDCLNCLRLTDVQRQNDARKARLTSNAWLAGMTGTGLEPQDDAGRLSLEEALEEADRHGGLRGWGRAMDAGRLSLEEALDAAYERVEQDRGDWGIAVYYAPLHEQRGEMVEPGTLLRNTVTGNIGRALGEHGIFSGNAWVKVRLLNPRTGRDLIEGEDGATRWSLSHLVRVDADAQPQPPFEPAPVATALPEISPAALGYVKTALSRPYGVLPLHMRTGMLNKLRSVGLIETKQVPRGRWLGYGYQERDVLTRKAFAH